MRFYLGWLMGGAFFGGAAATFVAPFVLKTLLASTGAQDAMCQCTELVSNTSSLLIKTQLYGAAAGALLFPIAAWLFRRKRASNSPPTAVAS